MMQADDGEEATTKLTDSGLQPVPEKMRLLEMLVETQIEILDGQSLSLNSMNCSRRDLE